MSIIESCGELTIDSIANRFERWYMRIDTEECAGTFEVQISLDRGSAAILASELPVRELKVGGAYSPGKQLVFFLSSKEQVSLTLYLEISSMRSVGGDAPVDRSQERCAGPVPGAMSIPHLTRGIIGRIVAVFLNHLDTSRYCFSHDDTVVDIENGSAEVDVFGAHLREVQLVFASW